MMQPWCALIGAVLTGMHYDPVTGIIVLCCLAAISPSNTG